MPEPPEEFERELREELDEMAGEAAPSPKAPPGVLRSARRRLARNSAAVFVALAMVTGGVVAGLQLTGRERGNAIPIAPSVGASPTPSDHPSLETPSPTTTCDNFHFKRGTCDEAPSGPGMSSSPPASSAPASPTTARSFVPWGRPGDASLFLDGVVYMFFPEIAPGPQAEIVGVIPEDTAARPPVATQYGVFVLGGRGPQSHLWLLRTQNGRSEIASGVMGFGVSADGTRLAYAVTRDGGRTSTLMEQPAGTTPAIVPPTTLRIDTSTSVVGFVGSRVVVETGDGAGAGVATWLPGESTLVPLDGYGSAVATDPRGGLAVLNEGDGTCWDVVQVLADGRARRIKRGDCGSQFVGVSFESGGGTLAGVELRSVERTGIQIIIVTGTDSQLGGALDLPGPFQTLWVGRGRYLVMAEPEPGHVTVTSCRISENMCPEPPIWEGSIAGGDGSAWIVEHRGVPG